MKVDNMEGKSGRGVPNQFIVRSDTAVYFQSYTTMIAKKQDGFLYLDAEKWDYSATTSKYRNRFTGLTTKETKAKIKSGEIMLVNLN